MCWMFLRKKGTPTDVTKFGRSKIGRGYEYCPAYWESVQSAAEGVGKTHLPKST